VTIQFSPVEGQFDSLSSMNAIQITWDDATHTSLVS